MLLTMLTFYGTLVVKTHASLYPPLTTPKKFNQSNNNQQNQNQIVEKYREEKKKRKKKKRKFCSLYIYIYFFFFFFHVTFFHWGGEMKSHEEDGEYNQYDYCITFVIISVHIRLKIAPP